MDEDEARRLLAAVRSTSDRTRSARATLSAEAAERSRAVRAALDAGIPRQQIADAAAVVRTKVYKLAAESE